MLTPVYEREIDSAQHVVTERRVNMLKLLLQIIFMF